MEPVQVPSTHIARRRHRKPPSRLARLTTYAAVGITTMLLGFGVMVVCIELLQLQYWLAYAIQTIVSVCFNYSLNRVTTFSDRSVPYWRGLLEFIGFRGAVTIPLNQVVFAILSHRGVPYWLAWGVGVGLTVVIGWFGAKFIFRDRHRSTPHSVNTGEKETRMPPSASIIDEMIWNAPHNGRFRISVIIPAKNGNEQTVETVQSLLTQQDLPTGMKASDIEIIVVADLHDSVGPLLFEHFPAHIASHQLRYVELGIESPGRDSNVKRSAGLRLASSTSAFLAVMDSDVIARPDWVARVIEYLSQGGIDAVSGPVYGLGDTFWDRYIDGNPVGAKMPRMGNDGGYILDQKTIGRHKPPVTAALAFTRELYDRVGGPPVNFTNSYEDYSWASCMVQHGLRIFCTETLACTRYHRIGFKRLRREYFRSGKGCADLIATYGKSCGFARKRRRQLKVIYSLPGILVGAACLAPLVVLGIGFIGILLLMMHAAAKTRRREAVVYPLLTVIFSTMFVAGLTRQLLTRNKLQNPHLYAARLLTAAEQVAASPAPEPVTAEAPATQPFEPETTLQIRLAPAPAEGLQ